jgi:hypothetical protein
MGRDNIINDVVTWETRGSECGELKNLSGTVPCVLPVGWRSVIKTLIVVDAVAITLFSIMMYRF